MPAVLRPASHPSRDLGAIPDPLPEERVSGFFWPPSLRSQALRGPRPEAVEADLLELAALGQNDRLLVIGGTGTDLVCAAARRGCRSGSAFREAPVHPDPVEVVIAPAVASEEAGRAVTACARRALPSGGRLALRLIGPKTVGAVAESAMSLATAVVARLRDSGFERVRLRNQAGGGVVVVGTLSHARGTLRSA